MPVPRVRYWSVAIHNYPSTRHLALRNGLQDCVLNAVSVVVHLHMAQHHDGGQKESGRVGKVFASNIGSRTVNLD